MIHSNVFINLYYLITTNAALVDYVVFFCKFMWHPPPHNAYNVITIFQYHPIVFCAASCYIVRIQFLFYCIVMSIYDFITLIYTGMDN